MIRIRRLLDIVQAIFAAVGVHEFLVSGETFLFFSQGEFVPRFNLVVVVIAGEAWTEMVSRGSIEGRDIIYRGTCTYRVQWQRRLGYTYFGQSWLDGWLLRTEAFPGVELLTSG